MAGAFLRVAALVLGPRTGLEGRTNDMGSEVRVMSHRLGRCRSESWYDVAGRCHPWPLASAPNGTKEERSWRWIGLPTGVHTEHSRSSWPKAGLCGVLNHRVRVETRAQVVGILRSGDAAEGA